MLERVLNTPVFRMDLMMFCVIITDIWWGILNSYIARGSSVFLWILQKNCLDNISSKHWKKQRLSFVNTIQYPHTLKNNIYHSNKQGPSQFFHSDTNLVLDHLLVHSIDKTHVLAVNVKLIWLLFLNILSINFVSTSNKSLGTKDSEEAM